MNAVEDAKRLIMEAVANLSGTVTEHQAMADAIMEAFWDIEDAATDLENSLAALREEHATLAAAQTEAQKAEVERLSALRVAHETFEAVEYEACMANPITHPSVTVSTEVLQDVLLTVADVLNPGGW